MQEKILEMLGAMHKRLGETNERFGSIDAKLHNINEKFQSIGTRLGKIDERFDNIEIELKSIKTQQYENNEAIRALENLSTLNKEEHDRMLANFAEIIEELKSMRKDLSKIELITANNWSELAKLKSLKYE